MKPCLSAIGQVHGRKVHIILRNTILLKESLNGWDSHELVKDAAKEVVGRDVVVTGPVLQHHFQPLPHWGVCGCLH